MPNHLDTSRSSLGPSTGISAWAIAAQARTRDLIADAPAGDKRTGECCIGYKVETAEGAFRVREDEPAPRVGAGPHRTP
ncbi:MAG TPA: hypothetical protein VNZ53_29960 [Steroidobacteraceae bacterium]|nr:hypothetical protein [Steroidobacteraceae bacterium]